MNQQFQSGAMDTGSNWLLLATTGKKQRAEVRLSSLHPDERCQFEAAQEGEISNWLKTGTVSRILRDQIPADQVLRCRWILTRKPLDPTDAKAQGRECKPKARLVTLGYLDPQLTEVPRDSPTLNKTSRMLLLQTVASNGWDLISFDIKAAFLQGSPNLIAL